MNKKIICISCLILYGLNVSKNFIVMNHNKKRFCLQYKIKEKFLIPDKKKYIFPQLLVFQEKKYIANIFSSREKVIIIINEFFRNTLFATMLRTYLVIYLCLLLSSISAFSSYYSCTAFKLKAQCTWENFSLLQNQIKNPS